MRCVRTKDGEYFLIKNEDNNNYYCQCNYTEDVITIEKGKVFKIIEVEEYIYLPKTYTKDDKVCVHHMEQILDTIMELNYFINTKDIVKIELPLKWDIFALGINQSLLIKLAFNEIEMRTIKKTYECSTAAHGVPIICFGKVLFKNDDVVLIKILTHTIQGKIKNVNEKAKMKFKKINNSLFIIQLRNIINTSNKQLVKIIESPKFEHSILFKLVIDKEFTIFDSFEKYMMLPKIQKSNQNEMIKFNIDNF